MELYVTACPAKVTMLPCVSSATPNLEAIDACIDSLSDELKADYVVARREAPDVIKRESHPNWFLEREKNDPQAAARRLATHWKHRKSIFRDRFMRPILDLSGEGALTKEELLFFERGAHYLLPTDKKGRAVMVNDHRVFSKDISGTKNVRIKSTFFYFVLISQSESVRAHGLVLVRISDQIAFDRDRINFLFNFIGDAMPFDCAAMHICTFGPKAARRVVRQRVYPIFKSFYEEMGMKLHFHTASTPDDMKASMEKVDVDASKLPAALGGACNPSAFVSVLLQYVEKAQTGELVADTDKNDAAAYYPYVGGLLKMSGLIRSGPTLVEMRKERKRTLDMEYARKRRKKEKEAESDLKDECLRLSKEKAVLQREMKRLQGLLLGANQVVLSQAAVYSNAVPSLPAHQLLLTSPTSPQALALPSIGLGSILSAPPLSVSALLGNRPGRPPRDSCFLARLLAARNAVAPRPRFADEDVLNRILATMRVQQGVSPLAADGDTLSASSSAELSPSLAARRLGAGLEPQQPQANLQQVSSEQLAGIYGNDLTSSLCGAPSDSAPVARDDSSVAAALLLELFTARNS